MKYFYYAVLTEDENDKQLSYALRVSASLNLVSVVKSLHNVRVVAPCSSKKEAVEITASWNKRAYSNRCYLYGDFQKYDFVQDA